MRIHPKELNKLDESYLIIGSLLAILVVIVIITSIHSIVGSILATLLSLLVLAALLSVLVLGSATLLLLLLALLVVIVVLVVVLVIILEISWSLVEIRSSEALVSSNEGHHAAHHHVRVLVLISEVRLAVHVSGHHVRVQEAHSSPLVGEELGSLGFILVDGDVDVVVLIEQIFYSSIASSFELGFSGIVGAFERDETTLDLLVTLGGFSHSGTSNSSEI